LSVNNVCYIIDCYLLFDVCIIETWRRIILKEQGVISKKFLHIFNRSSRRLLITVSFIILSVACSSALEKMGNDDLSQISGQSGVTIILDEFKITTELGLLAIGGEDGLGIPAAPDGAYFVFQNDRILEMDVERGSFDFDVFTQGSDYIINGDVIIPAGTTASRIDFGSALFNINMSDAILTLKFANNPEGNTGDGITEFSKTVCNFALNGSMVNIKSDDVKMYIFSH